MENLDKIEQWVKDLLAIAGFDNDNTCGTLYQTLYHEYLAIKFFEKLSDEDKQTVKKTERLLKIFFSCRFGLKENKKNKTENKESTPEPPKQKKEKIKEKKEKSSRPPKKSGRQDLEDRKKAFWQECQSYADTYNLEEINKFFTHWSMQSRNGGKMRFEKERFWDTEGKLKMWVNSRFALSDENVKTMLEQTKKRCKKQAVSIEEQQTAAVIREELDARREKEHEQSKRNQMLTSEYLSKHPNGILAKIAREREAKEKAKKKE